MVNKKQDKSLMESGEEQNMIIINSNPSRSHTSQPVVKSCSLCQTTYSTLWRGGPQGPKTLCKACGLKDYRKRKAMENGDADKPKIKKKKTMISNSSNSQEEEEEEEEGSSSSAPPEKKTVIHGGGTDLIDRRELEETELAATTLISLCRGSTKSIEKHLSD